MDGIPVYSLVAFSGSGKTTYLERLIPELKARGLRVGVVKHDAHEFEIDREGKDSWRFTRAGADVTAVVSAAKAAWIESRTLGLEELLERIRDVDVILTEGYKHGPWPKIALLRAGSGRGMALPPEACAAVVSDVPVETDRPVFPLEDPAALAGWLAADVGRRLRVPGPSAAGDPAAELTHFNAAGEAVMVDVSGKADTLREAAARGRIRVSGACFAAIRDGTAQKGDVLGVARVAGIMAAKRTPELIPLCHPIAITRAAVEFTLLPQRREVEATCTVSCAGKTGVEMEALTGVSAALLTIYDMCKAIDRTMLIGDIFLLRKRGGKSGPVAYQPPERAYGPGPEGRLP